MANKTRLDTTMETDFLQSFVRGNLTAFTAKSSNFVDTPKSPKRDSSEVVATDNLPKATKCVKILSPTSQMCSRFVAENAKEKAAAATRKTKRRTIKSEELYTDKDRAAAVNLGTRDIKQSLKLKQAQDRSKVLHIPEQADPAQFFALGIHQLRRNGMSIALGCMNKALELNPKDKNALVARSQCYTLLGQPENGLRDAETALAIDGKCLKAMYQKAEALYYIGDFEHSLMHFYRGLHIRPDHDGFKLGVEKAQKAIETALGSSILRINDNNNNFRSTTSKSRCNMKRKPILKELAADKEYLEGLLRNADLQSAQTNETVQVLQCVRETVDYLKNREEFWRQQMPASTPNSVFRQ